MSHVVKHQCEFIFFKMIEYPRIYRSLNFFYLTKRLNVIVNFIVLLVLPLWGIILRTINHFFFFFLWFYDRDAFLYPYVRGNISLRYYYYYLLFLLRFRSVRISILCFSSRYGRNNGQTTYYNTFVQTTWLRDRSKTLPNHLPWR